MQSSQPKGIGTSFRIDSKTFSLGFDGGRVDPYHIMERKCLFKGSLWLSLRGLRWVLGEIRIFQFLCDGYNTLEFSCLSNRGGRFVELLENHGGSQRGRIRVLEGLRCAG